MNLKRRVDMLIKRLTPPPRLAPQISAEDKAIMQRIVNRYYSDPVRYAKRIRILEQCRLKYEGSSA